MHLGLCKLTATIHASRESFWNVIVSLFLHFPKITSDRDHLLYLTLGSYYQNDLQKHVFFILILSERKFLDVCAL